MELNKSYNVDNIKKIVQYIQNSDRTDKEEFFAIKYKTFKKMYPTLFEKACRNELDEKTFNLMMFMLQKMENKEATDFEASACVGQALYDKYVKNLVATTPPKASGSS